MFLFMLLLLCQRTFGELLRKRIETSRAVREGLIEAQAAAFSFFRCIRSGYIQLVAKLQRELMYLCEAFLLGSVTPEAEDFFRNNVELSAWFTKIRAS